jgi:hypothetical protein
VADTGGTPEIKVTGTLSSDTDVDWYAVPVKDAAENGGNTLHVRISFDTNPNNEFVFLAFQGNDCTKEAAATPLTEFDWCVNFSSAMKGEAPCGEADGLNHCTDHSGTFLFAVKRAKAATPTCTPYVVKVQAAAGPCGAPDACGGGLGAMPFG